jgi:hypothetical protein
MIGKERSNPKRKQQLQKNGGGLFECINETGEHIVFEKRA